MRERQQREEGDQHVQITEGSERTETVRMKMRGSKDAKAWFQKGGMVQKRVGPSARNGGAQGEARRQRQTR